MSPSPHDEETARKVLISSCVALAIMIVDYIYLFRSEIKFVWPKLVSWGHPKGYVISRYLGLGCQIYNVYFTVRMYLGVPTTIEGCRLWFSFQAACVLLLLLIAEFMLMYRIYALFLKSKVICSILISLFVGQTAAMVVSAVLSFPTNKHTVTCLITRSSVGNVFFSTTTMATNILIFFMTFWRYLQLPKKCSQQGHIKVAFRDSAAAVLMISSIMLFMTLCSLQVIKPNMSGNITYYWFVCILFLAIGRLVVDHQKIYLAEPEGDEHGTWKGSVQLTSMIEVGESVWSLDTEVSSDVRTPSTGTLKVALSTPMTKASELSPSSCSSDGTRQWYGDHPFGDDVSQNRNSLRPSAMQMLTLASEAPSLPSSSAASSEDASQAEEYHSADTVASGKEGRNSPRPSNTTAVEESTPVPDEPLSSSSSTDKNNAPRSEGSDPTASEPSPSPSPRPSPSPSPPPQS
ncbi:hypothetical protein JVU11DRAFT_7342 [Chiua virens]|nr:hypothetical protein JVU11DRAFT_7342 [Chiua virens]